jgi:hypothetical protein
MLWAAHPGLLPRVWLLMDPAGIPALLDAIRHMHGVVAAHLETVQVDERHQGERVWSGAVEVFALTGHPLATKAYAWSEATTGTKRRFFSVLHVGPIDSAAKAVQGSILADARAVDGARRASRKT